MVTGHYQRSAENAVINYATFNAALLVHWPSSRPRRETSHASSAFKLRGSLRINVFMGKSQSMNMQTALHGDPWIGFP
jgi:hypothetical protein